MMQFTRLAVALVALLLIAQSRGRSQDDWLRPVESFRIFGNTYFVGTAGLTAVLVTGDAGHLLLDGGVPESARIVDANIRKLGFRTEDIELIVNSHEHFDHAGALAELQRLSGATVAASRDAARALRDGGPLPHDPQASSTRYPAVSNVRVIKDGETLRVGSFAVTAHLTPGHTPGATTWTWQSCEGVRCLNIVYADSLSAVADDGFRFAGDGKRPSIVEVFRKSLARVEALPCDVLLVPHPFAMGFDEKRARRTKDPAVNPFVDAGACRAYAAAQRKRFDERVASERRP